MREGLRFLDPTLQSRSQGNGQQGTGRHAGSAAETTHIRTRQAFRGPGIRGQGWRESLEIIRADYCSLTPVLL